MKKVFLLVLLTTLLLILGCAEQAEVPAEELSPEEALAEELSGGGAIAGQAIDINLPYQCSTLAGYTCRYKGSQVEVTSRGVTRVSNKESCPNSKNPSGANLG